MISIRLRLTPVLVRNLLTRPDLSVHSRRLAFRVWPVDCDINLHVNNARYLSFMDIGRWDLFLGLGMLQHGYRSKQKPVVAEISIRYHRSLQPGQKFILETELTDTRGKIFFLAQRFLVSEADDKEICYASAEVKGMMLGADGRPLHAGKALAQLNAGEPLVMEREAAEE